MRKRKRCQEESEGEKKVDKEKERAPEEKEEEAKEEEQEELAGGTRGHGHVAAAGPHVRAPPRRPTHSRLSRRHLVEKRDWPLALLRKEQHSDQKIILS